MAIRTCKESLTETKHYRVSMQHANCITYKQAELQRSLSQVFKVTTTRFLRSSSLSFLQPPRPSLVLRHCHQHPHQPRPGRRLPSTASLHRRCIKKKNHEISLRAAPATPVCGGRAPAGAAGGAGRARPLTGELGTSPAARRGSPSSPRPPRNDPLPPPRLDPSLLQRSRRPR